MLEKYRLKYIENVTESSLYPYSVNLQNPTGIHALAAEAYKGFHRYYDAMTPVEKQTAIQCVSVIATFSLLRKPPRLPGLRPLEEWEIAREEFAPTIRQAVQEISEATVRNGYLNLFKMLELGSTTWQDTKIPRQSKQKVGELPTGAKPKRSYIPKY